MVSKETLQFKRKGKKCGGQCERCNGQKNQELEDERKQGISDQCENDNSRVFSRRKHQVPYSRRIMNPKEDKKK